MEYDVVPTLIVLRGVRCTDTSQQGAGAFADVYCGTYGGLKVALKRLRAYIMMSDVEKDSLRKVCCAAGLTVYLMDAHDHPILVILSRIAALEKSLAPACSTIYWHI